MRKFNLLMSALTLTSLIPVFGAGAEYDWYSRTPDDGDVHVVIVGGSEYKKPYASDYISRKMSYRTNGIDFASEEIRFSDVMNKLNSALELIEWKYLTDNMDLEEKAALTRVLDNNKKYISSLPAYVTDLLKRYDFTDMQADLLNLKLLDIECANQERVLAGVDAGMAWLAVEELESALNAKGAFLQEMTRRHVNSKYVAKQISSLISYETASKIRHIKGQDDRHFVETNAEYLIGLTAMLSSLSLSREEGDSLSLSQIMERSLSLGL